MKKKMFFLMTVLFGQLLIVNGQILKKDSLYHHDNGDKIYLDKEVDKIAEFVKGEEKMWKWIANTVRYTQDALEKNIQGTVYGTFIVEIDGSLSDIKVIKGVCESLDKEYVRVVSTSPKWKPAIKNGKSVRMQYIFPLKFTLN